MTAWANSMALMLRYQPTPAMLEFYMPKFGDNLESSPLVVKRVLAGFHVHTNQLFKKCKNITAAEFLFTTSKGIKSSISQG